MDPVDLLIEASLHGDTRSIAQLISMVERGDDRAAYILKKIYPHSGDAYYIGVTGPPGAGKSTLVNRLVHRFCDDRYSVGIIAVDPSSPFSGGALLGDRIRIHLKDPKWDVFFRSMSAGKMMGGLARTSTDAARILDACGKQIIIIETVGVGQSELDIAQSADTVLVVLNPESGDSIQTLKAGLMEIADIFTVNKADRPGADAMAQSIEGMLDGARIGPDWRCPVFKTSAMHQQGIDDLYRGIWKHRRHLQQSSHLEVRRKAQIKTELLRRMEETVSRWVREDLMDEALIEHLANDVLEKRIDTESAVETAFEKWICHRVSPKSGANKNHGHKQ